MIECCFLYIVVWWLFGWMGILFSCGVWVSDKVLYSAYDIFIFFAC